MSALVRVPLAEACDVRHGGSRVAQPAAAGRRRVRATPAGRMVQPARPGRPVGVPGPTGSRHDVVAPRIPPPVLKIDVRLSDRGIAWVLGLATVLIIAALLCIGSTALRVTSEPPALAAVATR